MLPMWVWWIWGVKRVLVVVLLCCVQVWKAKWTSRWPPVHLCFLPGHTCARSRIPGTSGKKERSASCEASCTRDEKVCLSPSVFTSHCQLCVSKVQAFGKHSTDLHFVPSTFLAKTFLSFSNKTSGTVRKVLVKSFTLTQFVPYLFPMQRNPSDKYSLWQLVWWRKKLSIWPRVSWTVCLPALPFVLALSSVSSRHTKYQQTFIQNIFFLSLFSSCQKFKSVENCSFLEFLGPTLLILWFCPHMNRWGSRIAFQRLVTQD